MLLQRILDTPRLARAVPRLPPELLHRVIDRVGLEDAAALVALATPEQLSRVFDLDLWRPAQPGVDERFDAARFGVWLQVLLEGGAGLAAATIAAMPPEIVAAGLAQHVRVFDEAAVASYVTLDGELAGGRRETDDELTGEVGGYRIVERRSDAWDAIVELLTALDEAHPDQFHRLMGLCRARSNVRPEASGMHDLLDEPEQAMFDLTVDREDRRERRGFVAPAQARAFLEGARRPAPGQASSASGHIARASLRAAAEPDAAEPGPAAPIEAADGVGAVVDALLDAGILDTAPRGLLEAAAGAGSRLARLQRALAVVLERDPRLYADRTGELGFLANALVSGCSLQARAFTPPEASDAAAAVCNLALETCRPDTRDEVLVTHDLVSVFQIGWAALYQRAGLAAARRLVETLTIVRCRDRELQLDLDRLRRELAAQIEAGAPWRARTRLEVLASLDLTAWAALAGLLDECPVMHAGLGDTAGARAHRVDPAAFHFIAGERDLARIDAFLASLPHILST
jgi:hypothetical protein